MRIEFSLLLCAIVIIACIVSNKLSMKLGLPSLVMFLVMGMVFGSDGIVKIYFDNYALAEDICTLCVIFIMFYGGFCTSWKTAKAVIVPASMLSTLGVLITAILTALCCYFFLGFEKEISFLIGAVISCTDAASVFSILRSKQLNLKDGVAPLLEIESGSNDPMAYMLTLSAFIWMEGSNFSSLGPFIVMQVGVGVICGVVIALIGVLVLKKMNFFTNGFDILFVLAVIILSYALPTILGGNGLLSLYISGIIMGNGAIKNKINLVHFFDGITSLAQIMLFFFLGLLSFPSQLLPILPSSLAIALFLMFIARPVAVFIVLAPQKYPLRHLLLISWAGIRGASSILFAIIATLNGAGRENDVFHIVFCISLISVALQGTLLPWVARKLDIIDENSSVFKTFNDYQDESEMSLIEIIISEEHEWVHKKLSDVSIAYNSLALMIKREGETIIPNGDTEILPGDRVILSVPSYHSDGTTKLKEIIIEKGNPWKDKLVMDLPLPTGTLIVLIKREQGTLIPKGDTRIRENDTLVINGLSAL